MSNLFEIHQTPSFVVSLFVAIFKSKASFNITRLSLTMMETLRVLPQEWLFFDEGDRARSAIILDDGFLCCGINASRPFVDRKGKSFQSKRKD